MEEDIVSIEEMKQNLIDKYIDLMRIKRYQKEYNPELELQFKTVKVKLHTMGVNTDEIKYDD